MAFPNTPLAFVVELLIDGTWTDITADVRATSPITITRGRQDQASQAGPGKATLTLNNRHGRYSPLNTSSPYYRKIGRNTPLRVRVNEGGITAAVRFTGEVIEWPQRWDITGNDVWVPVEASGIMRRLSRNSAQLSAPYRLTTSYPTAPAYYWPLNDPNGSISAAPVIGDVHLVPLYDTPVPLFGTSTTAWLDTGMAIDQSPTIPEFGSVGAGHIAIPNFAGKFHVDCVIKLAKGGTGQVSWLASNSNTESWGIGFDAFDAPSLVFVFNPNFFSSVRATAPADVNDEQPHHIRASFAQNGANIDIKVYVDGVQRINVSDPGIFPNPLGSPTDFFELDVGPTDGCTFGHLTLWIGDSPLPIADIAKAVAGWQGENAVTRIQRLCAENDIPFTLVGTATDTTMVGPQSADALLTLLNEAANADGGVLYETRGQLGLSYRTRVSRYNQATAEALDYASGHLSPPLEPTQDDDAIVNDATVTRKFGRSARYQDTTGPLSVNQPPDGVGRYDSSFTLSLYRDEQAYEQAGWRVHLGTVDELRYPRVRVNLAANTALSQDVSRLDVGDRVTISNPPPWLPNETIDLQVEGYTETISSFVWDLTFNCVPNRPWLIGILDDDQSGKLDTAGSELVAAINATATTFNVVTTAGPLWTVDDAEFPFDVDIGHERCTVLDIAPATGDIQTFTVTRAINSYSTGHGAGTPVKLWTPIKLGL